MTNPSETQTQAGQPESASPATLLNRKKSVLALSIFALGLNAAAAVYTMSPSDFALPDLNTLAALLPHQQASDPASDPVVAALKDIQSAQQQHVSALLVNNSHMEQNTALLQQDSTTLAALRQSVTDEQTDVKKISAQITDEHVDVKKISAQITNEHVDVKKISEQVSALMAKVTSLQDAMAPAVTSSIPTGHAHIRLSRAARRRMAREPKPVGPVSIGGAPLSFPATTPDPRG